MKYFTPKISRNLTTLDVMYMDIIMELLLEAFGRNRTDGKTQNEPVHTHYITDLLPLHT